MNAPNLVSPDNAPRDLDNLLSLTRPKKYNLALALNMFANENEETAFVEAEESSQAQALYAALTQYDQHNGGPPQQVQLPLQAEEMNQQPPPPPGPQHTVTPQPLAAAPAPMHQASNQGYGGPPPPPAPQQYAQQGPPQGPPPQPGQQAAPPPPPLPQQGYQQPQQQPQYQNAPPPPLPPQGQPQQGQQPYQNYQNQQAAPQAMPPAPQARPPQGPPQGPPPGGQHYAQPGAAQGHQHPGQPYQHPGQPNMPPQAPPMARQPQTSGDPTNTRSEIEQLKSILLGMGRTQNMLTLLVLELCQNQLGMDKPSLAALAVKNSQQGEPERLFEQAASQGKVG